MRRKRSSQSCCPSFLLQAAGLHPTAEQIEMFAYHLPETTLSNLIVSGSSFHFSLANMRVITGSLHGQESASALATHEMYIAGGSLQHLG